MMMTRRELFRRLSESGLFVAAAGLTACGRSVGEVATVSEEPGDEFVIMYDTYAMALYMDGTLGPKTGIVRVDYVLKDELVTLEFWHGHGGRNHIYSVTPDHYAELKQMRKVVIETSAVEGHTHKLFVDFSDERWRVPGAQPVKVPRFSLRG